MNMIRIVFILFLFSQCKPTQDRFVKNEFKGYNFKIEMSIPDSLSLSKYDTVANGEKRISYLYKWKDYLRLIVKFEHTYSDTFNMQAFFDNCINRQNVLNINTVWLKKEITIINNHKVGLLEYSSESSNVEGYIMQAYIEEEGTLISITYQLIGRKEDLKIDLLESLKTIEVLN
jgi:hypothetical protein